MIASEFVVVVAFVVAVVEAVVEADGFELIVLGPVVIVVGLVVAAAAVAAGAQRLTLRNQQ